jgi:hypothetical protein
VEQTQEDLRLTQLNMRRKKKGLPRLNSLQEAIDKGIYHPRGGYTTGHPKQTHRRESLSKPRKGPNLPDSPSPLASSLATPGNGSERDKSLLAGVIVEELDKEIQALVFAKKVIQRRFQHVQTDR